MFSTHSIIWITIKAFGFLFVALLGGRYIALWIGKIFSKIHYDIGMKTGIVFSFGLLVAYLGTLVDLSPIVGAFAGGLILDNVYFKDFESPETTVRHLVEPISRFLAPFFFVYTGMQVRLETLADWPVLGVALGITLAAFVGKIIAGIGSGRGVNPWIVGIGMIPRGEVGLIFANVGRGLGVISDTVFSVVVVMVIFTTLIPPPILAVLLRKNPKS